MLSMGTPIAASAEMGVPRTGAHGVGAVCPGWLRGLQATCPAVPVDEPLIGVFEVSWGDLGRC